MQSALEAMRFQPPLSGVRAPSGISDTLRSHNPSEDRSLLLLGEAVDVLTACTLHFGKEVCAVLYALCCVMSAVLCAVCCAVCSVITDKCAEC